ncbi:glyoxalase [Microbacterium sp. NPDC058342]|uniref:glyoxalase n=1 Tax=Microbacterium sp. NPDC058342 TaxID=3346454 RepID=UPI0036542005
MPGLHHVEIWLADARLLGTSWRWLLTEVGFEQVQSWPGGASWAAGGTYLTLTTSPNLSAPAHDRRRPGVNHIAFRVGDRAALDSLMHGAAEQGWSPLYSERYPYAGGPDHCAGWLEDARGFKVEVVADEH